MTEEELTSIQTDLEAIKKAAGYYNNHNFCPTCGRCPTCGQWAAPYWPSPMYTGTGTAPKRPTYTVWC